MRPDGQQAGGMSEVGGHGQLPYMVSQATEFMAVAPRVWVSFAQRLPPRPPARDWDIPIVWQGRRQGLQP